jgi:hypothetical protein
MLASYAGEVLPAKEDVFREQRTGGPDMLHITDGESVAGTLRESAIPGDVKVYGDLMTKDRRQPALTGKRGARLALASSPG